MKRIRVFVYCVTQIYCFVLYAADDCSDLGSDLKKCTSEPIANIAKIIEREKESKISPRKLQIKLDMITVEIETQKKNGADAAKLQKLNTSRLVISTQLSEALKSTGDNGPIVPGLPGVGGESRPIKQKRRRSIVAYEAGKHEEEGPSCTRMSPQQNALGTRNDSPRPGPPGKELAKVRSFERVRSKVSEEQKIEDDDE